MGENLNFRILIEWRILCKNNSIMLLYYSNRSKGRYLDFKKIVKKILCKNPLVG